jgi:hypothetical protein
VVKLPPNPAGQRPATPSTTAPAGSQEIQGKEALRPAEQRRRTLALVTRSAELGRPMRRADARRVVLAYADAYDGRADGWNAWLQHRFNPTRDAALANIKAGGRGARR